MDGMKTSTTSMCHYECGQCSMEATVVANRQSRDAWRRHMATHPKRHDYRAWSWEVLPLEFG